MPRAKIPAKSCMRLREVFSRNVRLYRIHIGLSQEDLAAESGLDRTFVSSLERGVRNISIDNIELICSALSLPASELVADDFPLRWNLDETLTRAPRRARLYPTARK